MIGLTLALLFAPGKMDIAYVLKGDIWTCDLQGNGKARVAKSGDAPCWSPDHRKLCFRRGRAIVTYDFVEKRETTVWKDLKSKDEIGRPNWGPHFAIKRWETEKPPNGGDSILFELNYMAKPVMQMNSNGAKITEADFISVPVGREVEAPTWSPSGRSLAMAVNGDVWLTAIEEMGWESHRIVANAEYDFPTWRGDRYILFTRAFAWSPDEKKLAFIRSRVGGSGTNELWIANLTKIQDKPVAKSTAKLSEKVRTVSFTRDGKHLVCEAGDGQPAGVMVYDLGTRRWKMLVKDASEPAG